MNSKNVNRISSIDLISKIFIFLSLDNFAVISGSISKPSEIISRFLIRNYIKRKFQNNERFKSIDDGIKEESWKIVILARLSPVIPFFILNYALGITKIRFFHFIIASWIGMIPGTMTYVLMGSMGKAIVYGKKSLLEWGLLGIGIIATVFVSILISKIVKKS